MTTDLTSKRKQRVFESNRPEMASGLDAFVNHTVSIITSDGRNFIGTLKGFDQTINVIIDESHERVYSTTSGVEQVMLGLHIIRGDNVAIVGLIDDELDNRLNLANIKAEPLNSPETHSAGNP
jgi:U6 snRNA-associated Sm-like protein LSm8